MRYALLVARKKAGLTQEQMQQITSIDRNRYSRIELSKTDPTVTEAFAIAEAVDSDAQIFFCLKMRTKCAIKTISRTLPSQPEPKGGTNEVGDSRKEVESYKMSEILRIHARRCGKTIEVISREIIPSEEPPATLDMIADIILERMKQEGILLQNGQSGGDRGLVRSLCIRSCLYLNSIL